MEEIILRRYRRVLEEGRELPDLIVIDGGKGQLHSAVNSLKKLDLYGKIPIIGLAKRMEEIHRGKIIRTFYCFHVKLSILPFSRFPVQKYYT